MAEPPGILPSVSTATAPGTPATNTPRTPRKKAKPFEGGLQLLFGMVAAMWVLEVINTLDSNQLDLDGLWSRNVSRLWGILTMPFLHASFQHLIGNTIPFVFLGVIIAIKGAQRLAIVTGIVIVLGGLGTWLIGPANTPTVGASGVVFGYASYLLIRGVFNRNVLELLTGGVVAALWGGALVSSLVPHYGISWQGHLCGGIAGVVAAWLLSGQDRSKRAKPKPSSVSARPPSI